MIFWMKNEKKRTAIRSLHQQEQKESRVKRFFFLIACVGIASVSFILFQIYQFFLVRTITCTFENDPCTQEQMASIHWLYGKPMFSTISVNDPYFVVSLHKQFPQTVSILFANPKVTRSLYRRAEKQEIVGITEKGMLISSNMQPESPILTDLRIQTHPMKTQLDEEIINSYKAIDAITTSLADIGLLEISIEDKQTIYWQFTDNLTVITDTYSLELQMRSLQLLQESPTIDLSNQEVDLRFAKPVVTKKK